MWDGTKLNESLDRLKPLRGSYLMRSSIHFIFGTNSSFSARETFDQISIRDEIWRPSLLAGWNVNAYNEP